MNERCQNQFGTRPVRDDRCRLSANARRVYANFEYAIISEAPPSVVRLHRTNCLSDTEGAKRRFYSPAF